MTQDATAIPAKAQSPLQQPLRGLKILLHSSLALSLDDQQYAALRRRLVSELGATSITARLNPDTPQQVTHIIVDPIRLQQHNPAALAALAEELRPALQAIQSAHPTLELTPEALSSRMRVVGPGWLELVVQRSRRMPAGPYHVAGVLEEASRAWRRSQQPTGGAPAPPPLPSGPLASGTHPALSPVPRVKEGDGEMAEVEGARRQVNSTGSELLGDGGRGGGGQAKGEVGVMHPNGGSGVHRGGRPRHHLASPNRLPLPLSPTPSASRRATTDVSGISGLGPTVNHGNRQRGDSGSGSARDGGGGGSDDSDGRVSGVQGNDVDQGRPAAGWIPIPRQPHPLLGPRPSPEAPLARFAAWLGEWHTRLDSVSRVSELVMYGVYDIKRCAFIGNGPIDEALRELIKFEEALAGPRANTNRTDDPTSHPSTTIQGRRAATTTAAPTTFGRAVAAGSGLINHQALNYAHAAAVVRACAFRITPDMPPKQLQDTLPYIGPFTARIIHQLALSAVGCGGDGEGGERGSVGCSCEPLEAFQADQPARDSRGRLRPSTEGASTRRMFCRLPGCGPVLARYWWERGFRTFQQLQAAGEAARRAEGLPPLTEGSSTGAPEPLRSPTAGGGAPQEGRRRRLSELGVDALVDERGEINRDEDGLGWGRGDDDGTWQWPWQRRRRLDGSRGTGAATPLRAGEGEDEEEIKGGKGYEGEEKGGAAPRGAAQSGGMPVAAASGCRDEDDDVSDRGDGRDSGGVSLYDSDDGGVSLYDSDDGAVGGWGDGGEAAAGGLAATAAAAYAHRGGRSSSRGGGGREGWWRREVWYSLVFREQLAERVTEEEVAEMRRVLLSALASVSGYCGWLLVQVGGGRRGRAKEDADFLATHPQHWHTLPHGRGGGQGQVVLELRAASGWRGPEQAAGCASEDEDGGDNGGGSNGQGGGGSGGGGGTALVVRLYERLVAVGRVVPLERGFCRLQVNHEPGYVEAMKRMVAAGRWGGEDQLDRYDHLWCIWITGAGRRRRLDVMLVPYGLQWPYAVVGWTGSKQYLRFMRLHALNCGMFTNSHATLRQNPGGEVCLVPQEALPTDSHGCEFEPHGWQERGQREQQRVAAQEAAAAAAFAFAAGKGSVGAAAEAEAEADARDAAGPALTLEAVEVIPGGLRTSLLSNITAQATACAGGPYRTGLRPVASERDISELMRVPWREAHERNA